MYSPDARARSRLRLTAGPKRPGCELTLHPVVAEVRKPRGRCTAVYVDEPFQFPSSGKILVDNAA